MLDNNYYKEFEKAYIAKKEEDIEAVNDFCEKYDEKIGVQEIPDLLRLFNGSTYINE